MRAIIALKSGMARERAMAFLDLQLVYAVAGWMG